MRSLLIFLAMIPAASLADSWQRTSGGPTPSEDAGRRRVVRTATPTLAALGTLDPDSPLDLHGSVVAGAR